MMGQTMAIVRYQMDYSGSQECVCDHGIYCDLDCGLCTGRWGRDNNMSGGNEVSGWSIVA